MKFGFLRARWIFFRVLWVMTEAAWDMSKQALKVTQRSYLVNFLWRCIKLRLWCEWLKWNMFSAFKNPEEESSWWWLLDYVFRGGWTLHSLSYFTFCLRWKSSRFSPANWINGQLPFKEVYFGLWDRNTYKSVVLALLDYLLFVILGCYFLSRLFTLSSKYMAEIYPAI